MVVQRRKQEAAAHQDHRTVEAAAAGSRPVVEVVEVEEVGAAGSSPRQSLRNRQPKR